MRAASKRHTKTTRSTRVCLPAPTKMISSRAIPRARVAMLITEGSPDRPRSPAAENPRGAAPADSSSRVVSGEQMLRTCPSRPCTGQVMAEQEHIAECPSALARLVLLLLHDFPDPGKSLRFRVSSPPSDTQGLPTEMPVSYRQNSGGDLVFSMTPGSDTGADRGPAFPECWRACCGAAGWPEARLTCRAEGAGWRGLLVPVSRRGGSCAGLTGVAAPAG